MLKRVSHLDGSAVHASDGLIGHVTDLYFDDEKWAVRYLVVDTGSWLASRRVLISPYSVLSPVLDDKRVEVMLTRTQIEHSPDIDTHQPVSRRHELELLEYYAYPDYWNATGLWGMSMLPYFTPLPPVPTDPELVAIRAERKAHVSSADVRLRSVSEVQGDEIRALDGSIGHVADFLYDDTSWALSHVVVDTRNWWPAGKKVLVEVQWIDRISWADRAVDISLTRAQIKQAPAYHDKLPIAEALELQQPAQGAVERSGDWS